MSVRKNAHRLPIANEESLKALQSFLGFLLSFSSLISVAFIIVFDHRLVGLFFSS